MRTGCSRHALALPPIAALLSLPLLAGCTDTGTPGSTSAPTATTSTTPAPTGTASGPATSVQFSALLADPGPYLGQRVQVTAMADFVAPFVCTVRDPAATATPTATTETGTTTPTGSATPSGTADRVLVLHGSTTGFTAGQAVTITGTVVRGVDLAAVERALNIDDSTVRRLGVGTEFFLQADTIAPA